MMNWYNKLKINKESRRGWPLIDQEHYDPYTRSKPGDQNGGEGGTSYLSAPGSTGLGSNYTKTKGPKGVDLGMSQDIDDSEMPDLPSATDGLDPSKSNDGRTPDNTEYGLGFGEKGWEPWYDDNFPESSDNYDKNTSMKGGSPRGNSFRNVYDELVSKRKK